MKKYSSLILLLIAFGGTVFAQTNTFPDTGKAGIGTTSPGTDLHIRTDGTNSPWLALDKNSGQETGIQFRKSGSVLFYVYSDNADSDALKIQSTGLTGEGDATPRIEIPYINKNLFLTTSGGNVAIGHKSPAYKLDVYSPGDTWKAKFHGDDGYILFGPANEHWAHIYTDRPHFLFNQDVYSISGGFSSYSTADLSLQTHGTTRVTILKSNGNVGIGTASPNEKLTVNGTIYGKEVRVDLSVPGPDYVFEDEYKLPSLEEVKAYIEQNKHLPDVPSAKVMQENGIELGEMNMILLKKVEELTLYVIELEKESQKQDELMKKMEEMTLYMLALKIENEKIRKNLKMK